MAPTVTATKRRRHIAIKVDASQWGGGVSIASKVSVDIDTDAARQLAAAILAAADQIDLVTAKEAAANDRRKKWRDREVAAGRMQVVSLQQIFSRDRS